MSITDSQHGKKSNQILYYSIVWSNTWPWTETLSLLIPVLWEFFYNNLPQGPKTYSKSSRACPKWVTLTCFKIIMWLIKNFLKNSLYVFLVKNINLERMLCCCYHYYYHCEDDDALCFPFTTKSKPTSPKGFPFIAKAY